MQDLWLFHQEELCKEKCFNKNSITHYDIPMIHSPRASFVTFLYSILNIFEDALPIEKKEVSESIQGR